MWNKTFFPGSHCPRSVYIRLTDLTPKENKGVLFPGRAKRSALVVSLMSHWDYLYKIRKYLPLEAQHSPNCEVSYNRCQFVQTEVTRHDLSAVDIGNIATRYPREARPKRPQENMLILQCTDVLSNERILLSSMKRVKFLQTLWRCMVVVHTGLTIFYSSNAQVLHVSAMLPPTLTELNNFPR